MKAYKFILLVFWPALQAIEPLIVEEKTVYTVASFESVDFFTTYSHEGEFLWEIPFNTKIESIQENNDRILFLSKMRDETAYILSCFDKTTGTLIWEKAILSPIRGQVSQE